MSGGSDEAALLPAGRAVSGRSVVRVVLEPRSARPARLSIGVPPAPSPDTLGTDPPTPANTELCSTHEVQTMTTDRFAPKLARIAVCFAALGSWLSSAPALAAACHRTTAECRDGRFTAPFAEPTILGVPTSEKCVTAADGQLACKP